MWNKRQVVKPKNANGELKKRMIRIRGTRAKIGKTTSFIFNDKQFSDAKLNRHIAEKKLDEADLTALGHCSGGNSLLLMLSQVLIPS
jgi:hypothetical protein